jgi:regulatory protein
VADSEIKKEFTATLHRAIDLLARREHSAQELVAKLTQKGFELHVIQEVLDRLQSESLQSDDRYAEAFVNERMRRGHGPVKILSELNNKGVSQSLISVYVDPQDYEWTKIAQFEYQKKYANSEVNNYNEWTKRARFLQGRGFTTQQIRASVIFTSDVD